MPKDFLTIFRQKRPFFVWFLAILYSAGAGFSLLSYYVVFSGTVPMPAELAMYIAQLTALDHALSLGVMLANLTGAVLLFLLKKYCLYFFIASFALNLITSARTSQFIRGQLQWNPMPALIGLAVLLTVCLYVHNLTKKGILR